MPDDQVRLSWVMYEIRCPECQKTMKSPFVRRGAVADCAHCSLRFRVGSEHIQRMMLVMDPVAEGELATAGAGFRGVEVANSGASGGEAVRSSTAGLQPHSTLLARLKELPREVVVMWSSIAAGVVCLMLLVVLVVSLVGSGNRGASGNERIAQPLPHSDNAGGHSESIDRRPAASGNGRDAHEVKIDEGGTPVGRDVDWNGDDNALPFHGDAPQSHGGHEGDSGADEIVPREPVENGDHPFVNGRDGTMPANPPPPLPGLVRPQGGG